MENTTAEKKLASSKQKEIIAKAIKENRYPRMIFRDWNELTEQSAKFIIQKIDESANDRRAEATTTVASAPAIQNPEARASRAQLALIGKAVKDGKLERFSSEVWAKLTKGEASAIIDELTKGKERPATDRQKEKISELVKAGFLNRVPYGIYKNLQASVASKLIYVGKQRETAGEHAPEYVHLEENIKDEFKTIKETLNEMALTSKNKNMVYDEIPF